LRLTTALRIALDLDHSVFPLRAHPERKRTYTGVRVISALARDGNGTTTNSSTPVQVAGLTSGVTAIAVGGGNATCAIVSGSAECWGYNGIGELGNGTNTSSTTPVQVTGLTSGLTAISAGGNDSMLAN
jgi:alpha-tubulin suppressor-like RCC1 family protein